MDRQQASKKRTPLFLLNAESVIERLEREGEGLDLFSMPLPSALNGKTLAESAIGAQTGLNVVAVQQNGEFITSPPASTVLKPGSKLLMFGDTDQRRHFADLFGSG